MNSEQSQFDVLPSYAAPAGGRLTDEMLDIYDKAGVILVRDFVSAKACKAPRERALELVEQFGPAAAGKRSRFRARSGFHAAMGCPVRPEPRRWLSGKRIT